ncbi:hypothetical protein BD408DRAFT_337958 [Parasitella parasitica]|nr:hypothetical protein BD408DRAFT_337958 [Parasitella parasitica]
MPSPSDYSSNTPVVNSWQESNKTLQEHDFSSNAPQQPVNAYQYAGTAYGNTSSPQPTHTPAPAAAPISTTPAKLETTNSPAIGNDGDLPSKIRLILRIVLFVFAVGHLGFAAGASPFSGVDVPFDSKACFYFLFAVVSCIIPAQHTMGHLIKANTIGHYVHYLLWVSHRLLSFQKVRQST